MKTTFILAPLSAAALLVATTTATAQFARFSDIDRNGDGALSYQELEQAFGRAGADRVWSRGDGRDLSRTDVRRINQRRDDVDDGGFDDDDDDGFDDDGRDDDDDDSGSSRSANGDDDDNDGRSSDDDDDDGADDDDD